jgi:non-ribosomal peptide synthase protein (TIGR01720 family)
VVEHHDALRLRFVQKGGAWQQHNAPAESQPVFTALDLSGLGEAAASKQVEQVSAALQASLDLSHGPLLRLCWLSMPEGGKPRLLIAIHHLAVDGVSWRILLQDLETACRQLQAGQRVQLPPKTSSFQQWAQALVGYANTEVLAGEGDYWEALASQPATPVACDYPDGVNSVASTARVSVELSVEDTQALLQEVPRAFRTEINHALLAALLETIAACTGQSGLWLDMEGHGREDIGADLDVTRTVGWFTCLYPVYLRRPASATAGATLVSVKQQVRTIPRRGIGYGLLRYLRPERRLASFPPAEISFNYLGQFDQLFAAGSLFVPAPESAGPSQAASGLRPYVWDISARIIGDRLQLSWDYSTNLHRETTIRTLADRFAVELRNLVTCSQSPQAGIVSPDDFGLPNLSEAELIRAFSEVGLQSK